VMAGGSITLGLGITTVAFGIATQNAHDDYARSPSRALYDDGTRKQDFTNGFFWGTVAAGVLTTAIAVFLVDWKRPLLSF
jgi:hypothetical protein